MKLIILILFLGSFFSNSQTTVITDANFEQALIDLGLDFGIVDGLVTTSSIDTVTTLSLISLNINNLDGIEDFTSLIDLDCSDNNILTLDLSDNPNLNLLSCQYNSLTDLNVTQNNSLTYLSCFDNSLSSIDISQNTQLLTLLCFENTLDTLNLTNNTAITLLSCHMNNLTSLDVSNNINLWKLNFHFNDIEFVDLSNNLALEDISCYNNASLIGLDLSMCSNLVGLWCYECPQLACLNLKNGNNTNYQNFQVHTNPNLTCIQVDDEIWSTNNWLGVDTWSFFSQNCLNSCVLAVPEELKLSESTLIKIVDVLGRLTTFTPNTPLFFIYSDGTIKKVFKVE